MKPILYSKNLSVGHRHWKGKSTVLHSDLNLSLYEGNLTCLLGRNGVGKTTLLQVIAGLLQSLKGEIYINEQSLRVVPAKKIAREIAIVLTGKYSGGPMTVEQLVGLGRIPYTNYWGRFSEKDTEITHAALERMGCIQFSGRDIQTLSDGERQKVMIARALAQQPRILLLDEPTAFLDVPHRIELIYLLQSLAKEQQMAVLFTTHDMELALKISDRIWLLQKESAFLDETPEFLIQKGIINGMFQKEGIGFDSIEGTFRRNLSQDEKSIKNFQRKAS